MFKVTNRYRTLPLDEAEDEPEKSKLAIPDPEDPSVVSSLRRSIEIL